MDRNQTPLRTNAIDCVMWEISKSRQHSCALVIFELDEPLYDDDLYRSVQNLTRLVPILVAKPKFGFWRGQWDFDGHPDIHNLVIRLKAKTEEETDHLFNETIKNPIDVEKDAFIRVTSIDGPTKHYLMLQVHHFAMDGGGIRSLLAHFARCYRESRENPDWAPEKTLNMERSLWQIARKVKWRQILQGARMVTQKTAYDPCHSVIQGDFPGVSDAVGKPHLASLLVASPDFEKVTRFIREAGYSINDLLAATTLSAVYHWNKERGQDSSIVRTSFGFDLRRWGKPEGTFANLSGSDMIEENSENLGDMKKAIDSVSSRMKKKKATLGLKQFGMLLLFSPISGYRIRRKIAPRIVKAYRDIQSKSHSFSNVGALPESIGDFGHAQALSCSIAGPFSLMPNVFLLASTYKDNLTLNMTFDGDYMKPETADRFLGSWKQHMMSLS
jgi:NRPS condensation-like uncharacterized protein